MKTFKSIYAQVLCGLALVVAAHTTVAASASVLDTELASIKEKFKGGSSDVSNGVNQLEWTGITNPQLFDEIAKRLESGYTDIAESSVELNSWLVKGLALSGDTKYQELLNTILVRKDIKKLNRHTANSLIRLQQFHRWNPIIAANNQSAKTQQELIAIRVSNMLNSNDEDLLRGAIDQIENHFPHDANMMAAVNSLLLKNHASRDKVQIRVLGDMCKLLGQSGFVQYKATLDQLAVDHDTNRRVRKYAKKYAAVLANK